MRRYISSGCTDLYICAFVLYKYLVTQYDNVNDFISEGLSAPPVLRKAAAIPREWTDIGKYFRQPRIQVEVSVLKFHCSELTR